MLLRIESLRREFQRGARTVKAVDNVDLTVAEGDFITITGESGSGKTTLLTILSGLLAPSGGTVLFNGADLHALPDEALSAVRNKDIGFIPQGAGLLGNFTVFDNVRMPQVFAVGNGLASERAAFLLDAVGLSHLTDEYPAHLSGGEMRRVAIARALFNNPRLLVADEPTNDLDPDNAREVMHLLERVNTHGTAVMVVTHAETAACRGRRRFRMHAGKLVPLLPDEEPCLLVDTGSGQPS